VTWWIIAVVVLGGVALMVEERSGILQVGTTAPDFSATLSNGNQIALRDFRGKNPVILFFYPADFTQGCTREACAFRDSYKALEEAGAVLIGVSQDSDSSHTRFSQEYQLYYPLISDTDRAISRAYGVERLNGRIPLPKRVTYVIDKKGVVRNAIHHEIMMGWHVTDVQRALTELAGE
jgi:thioredoxin-dependent peroxiredoxin